MLSKSGPILSDASPYRFEACFSSGPTRKHPEWSVEALKDVAAGRSHRSQIGLKKLKDIVDLTRNLLNVPDDYRIALMPGSATGAIEAAMWQLLGPLPVSMHVCDVFTQLWADDIERELKLDHTLVKITRDHIPVFHDNSLSDIVLAINGTTTGFRYPNFEWLEKDREGLVIADATSAAFCMEIPWYSLDAVAFSWQKGLGSEAAHGMLVLSPKAVDRLLTYTPSWPIPRLFKLTRKDGTLNEAVFEGVTLNTPSMLAVEDCLSALHWVKDHGGGSGVIEKCSRNFQRLSHLISMDNRFDLAFKGDLNSPSSPCFIVKEWENLDVVDRWQRYVSIAQKLERENVAYDIANHAHSFPAFRLWCGPMVAEQDVERVFNHIAQEI